MNNGEVLYPIKTIDPLPEDEVSHLQWCKDRAMEYFDRGDFIQAYNSFVSDMSKDPSTVNHSWLPMFNQLIGTSLMSGKLDPTLLKNQILGFA